MSRIAQLGEILEMQKRMGLSNPVNLNPGLTSHELSACPLFQNLPAGSELRDLYAWRNGSKPGVPMGKLCKRRYLSLAFRPRVTMSLSYMKACDQKHLSTQFPAVSRIHAKAIRRYFALLPLLVTLSALNACAAVNLSFSGSFSITNNFGLFGDGPGDMSDLLTDTNGVDTCHLITYDILPSGGRLYLAGMLGINSPGVDGDNLFEPSGAEAWTFGFDRDVVLNSFLLSRSRVAAPSNSPMVMTIRSPAWIGQNWNYTPAPNDTNRVYQFDSLTGTFTFTGYPTNGEPSTRFTFRPGEVFPSASLFVPAGSPITLSNDGLTWAGLREMNFQIVPEPSTTGLLAIAACCSLRLRRSTNSGRKQEAGPPNRAATVRERPC